MDQIDQTVLDTTEKYHLIGEKDSLLIAVSGGPDSTALFHLMVRLFPGQVKGAVYIEHNLRPKETASEIEHVKEMCRLSFVSFHKGNVNVPVEKKATGESTEECARRLRYQIFEEIRLKTGSDLTAVGHTSDDLVEEVFIRLIRGSGLKGLSGINPSYGRIIRPLINLSKKQVLDYLERNNLNYCMDSSNLSRDYLRNRVRLDLLPILEKKFNPSIRKTVRRTAEILADEESFIADEAQRHYQAIVRSYPSPLHPGLKDLAYPTAKFIDIHDAIKRRIIEKLFLASGAEPSFQSIQDVVWLSQEGQTGAEMHMNSGLKIHKSSDEVIFSVTPGKKRSHRNPESFDDMVVIDVPGEYHVEQLRKTLVLTKHTSPPSKFSPGHLFVSLDKNIFPMTLRTPVHGECFTPLGAPGRKKISRFLSDRKIPRHLRHTFPVLASGDEIIAVAGLAVSDAFRISSATSACLEIFWK